MWNPSQLCGTNFLVFLGTWAMMSGILVRPHRTDTNPSKHPAAAANGFWVQHRFLTKIAVGQSSHVRVGSCRQYTNRPCQLRFLFFFFLTATSFVPSISRPIALEKRWIKVGQDCW